MKTRYTKKEIKSIGNVVKVGYCNLQFLLRFRDPFGYSSRAEGWACDYYRLNNTIISTGYDPIEKSISYDVCRKYDEKAAKILGSRWPWKRQKAEIEKLIAKFESEIG